MEETTPQEALYDSISAAGNIVETCDRARIIFKNSPRNLCERCKNSHLFVRRYNNEMSVYCTNINSYVPIDIRECNAYCPVGRVSLWDLSKMAKMIEKPSGDGGHYF